MVSNILLYLKRLAKSDAIWYFPLDKVHHNLLWKEWKNLEDCQKVVVTCELYTQLKSRPSSIQGSVNAVIEFKLGNITSKQRITE